MDSTQARCGETISLRLEQEGDLRLLKQTANRLAGGNVTRYLRNKIREDLKRTAQLNALAPDQKS